MRESEIEELRRKLYSECIYFNQESISGEFRNDFLRFLEQCNLSMIEGGDNFFGLFMINVKREIDIEITEPIGTIVSIGGFIMYFNPKIILQYDLKQIKALIKHEIYHIMYSHHSRAKKLYKNYCRKAVNIAMDIAVNQFINNLPPNAFKIETINMIYNLSLGYDETLESYAKVLDELFKSKRNHHKVTAMNKEAGLEKREKNAETMHSLWENNIEKVDDNYFKSMVKKIANKSNKGTMPEGLENIINTLNHKPELDWIGYLKNQVSAMTFGYKKTSMRRDRRQPYRYDLRGTLRDHVAKIIVAIDVSASMTEEEINSILKEIIYISKNHPIEITIIECDSEIRRIYSLKHYSEIKKRLKRTGATSFSPVFEYIKKNNLSTSVLVYFTDGEGEGELTVKPRNYSTLWVLCGDKELSLKNSYGEIKPLKKCKNNKESIAEALEIYRTTSDIQNRVHM